MKKKKKERCCEPHPGTCQGDPFANYRGVVQGHSPADAERFGSRQGNAYTSSSQQFRDANSF